MIDKLRYYFNILCECFNNDEPKSPPAYKREIINSFNKTDDLPYTRFYKNYNHKEYDYL